MILNRAAVIVIAIVLVLGLGSAAGAQDGPVAESGVMAVVPLVDNIVIDGDLSDWASIPSVTTSNGPQPPADPANTGQVNWRIASVGESLAFSATVVDATIVAGQHGGNYWNEDSVELYVNFSGDQNATEYAPGIGQLTVSPVDIGNTDPTALTITGENASDFVVNGFVFATTDGWGLEISIDLGGLVSPAPLDQFGLQVQANGSSGGDRDTKLIWSLADVDDRSFTDPSVFGTGVFIDGAAETSDATATEGAGDAGALVDEPTELVIDESAVVDVVPESEAVASGDEVVARGEQPPSSRFFLASAIITAATLLIGGVLIERKRQADEKRSAPTPD